MIKVIIADDHAIVRRGLKALINAEPTMLLIGEASGGQAAMEAVEVDQPNVLILDLSMPDLDGIEVTRRLKKHFPEIHILILTVHEDDALLKAAMNAGASGYILKRAAENELVAAVHRILQGDLYVDPSMVRSLFNETDPSPVSRPGAAEELTPRETEVLRLIAEGYTNRQIGEELRISVRTAESHRANLSAKLGLQNRVELVRYAREHNLSE
jgi:two-component system response regulator NreC